MEKEEILESIRSITKDIDAHAYNDYKNNDEVRLYLTIKQLYWLEKTLLELNEQ